jgi:hypothetical protein
MIEEAAMLKFKHNPEDVSWGLRLEVLGERQREKVTIKIFSCPYLGLMVTPNLAQFGQQCETKKPSSTLNH